ncbi:hypothetical protein [Polaribacter cellanae]|uniref:Uncharacterized protein n=1 Tax=Polaribacter cellanae TaxID=2818493 RepID=A0A975H6Z3_9FLAO|nr:hypothetical protein [Polaribacter cellanae]QTE22966.1 hypothetical protein J3359_01445 [Polaribacter cellanae]
MKKILLILIMFLFSEIVYGQEKDNLIKDIFSQLSISKQNFSKKFFRVKKINYDSSIILLPFFIPDNEFSNEAGTYDVYILKLYKNKILKKKLFKSLWFTDANALIDVAVLIPDFILSDRNNNIIIKAHYKSSSKVNQSYSKLSSIFIEEKRSFKEVLKDFPSYLYIDESNWDRTNVVSSTEKKRISVSTKKNKEFYDLLIKSNTKIETTSNDSIIASKTFRRVDTLKFNGTLYNFKNTD